MSFAIRQRDFKVRFGLTRWAREFVDDPSECCICFHIHRIYRKGAVVAIEFLRFRTSQTVHVAKRGPNPLIRWVVCKKTFQFIIYLLCNPGF